MNSNKRIVSQPLKVPKALRILNNCTIDINNYGNFWN